MFVYNDIRSSFHGQSERLDLKIVHSNLNIWVILGHKLFLEVIHEGRLATNGDPFLPFAHTTRICYLWGLWVLTRFRICWRFWSWQPAFRIMKNKCLFTNHPRIRYFCYITDQELENNTNLGTWAYLGFLMVLEWLGTGASSVLESQ